MDFTGSLINEFHSLPAFWWLWLISVAVGVGVVYKLICGREISTRTRLLAAYVVFILMETIIGRKPGIARAEFIPFWSYSHPELRTEIILNYILFVPFYLQRENQENKEPARREDHNVFHRSIKHLKQSPNLADQAHVISPRSNISLYTPDHNHRPIHTCSRPQWNQAGSSYLILMNSSCLYQHP